MTAESRWPAVADLGQSVWYDNVARPALEDGHLAQLVERDHVTGGTSNPSIFSKAVLDSDVYDEAIGAADASDSDADVFERLWIEDIQRACDLLRPVWDRTNGADGYISIEEEADLAFEVEGAVRRAHELRALVDRPNVMVKVPGTDAGVEAFRRLTREGLNINMTLLFSRERYRQIAEAYVGALTERVEAGEDVSTIASVASFFVSRIDVQADKQLPDDSPLRGRIAVANAKVAYADVFLATHSGPEWERLAAAGANPQKPLWASTGGKNPDYSPTLYIDELIGENTITTVPDATLDAFRDADAPAASAFTILDGLDQARADLAALAEAGVDLDEITSRLERDGVSAFADAYAEMLEAIARKREGDRGLVTPAGATTDPAEQQLLDAAERLFYANGIRAVGMDALRAESGLSFKRIYQLHEGKDDIVVAFLRRRDGRWRGRLSAHVEAVRDPRERVLAVFDWLHSWFSEPDFRGCAWINAFGELGGTTPAVTAEVRRHKDAFARDLRRWCDDAGCAPETATALFLLAEGAMVAAAIQGSPRPARDARRAAAALLAADPGTAAAAA